MNDVTDSYLRLELICEEQCARANEAEKREALLKEENARLREALKPFARYVRLRGSAMPDDTNMDSVIEGGPTLGDCRTALWLLEGKQK